MEPYTQREQRVRLGQGCLKHSSQCSSIVSQKLGRSANSWTPPQADSRAGFRKSVFKKVFQLVFLHRKPRHQPHCGGEKGGPGTSRDSLRIRWLEAAEAKLESGPDSQPSAFPIASEEEAELLQTISKPFVTIYGISVYLPAMDLEP